MTATEAQLPAESAHCRVCGGSRLAPFRASTVDWRTLGPGDFAITDRRYGLTGALEVCADCGFVQCSEFPEVLKYYEALEDDEYEAGRTARVRQCRWLLRRLRRFAPSGRLLDVGAGTGMLVQEALAAGYDAEGLEPSTQMSHMARERGLNIATGTLESIVVTDPYDVLTCVDVVEHVDDPATLVRDIRRALAPGGVLAMVTPDVASLAAKVVGARWWHYRVAHVNYFSRSTLSRLLQGEGFRVLRVLAPRWYFPVGYLWTRASGYLPAVLRTEGPGPIANLVVPLQLMDSMMMICEASE